MYIFSKNILLMFWTLALVLCGPAHGQEVGSEGVLDSFTARENQKKSTIKKLTFNSRDWLSPEIEDINIHVTVSLMSPRLTGVSYLFDDNLGNIEDNQKVLGFMYCVNRYLVVESGYLYAAIGVEKVTTEKNRVNFLLSVMNKGELPTKSGTYAGIPWFDKVLAEEFKWENFIFLNPASEGTCAQMMKPDYSFRLIAAPV